MHGWQDSEINPTTDLSLSSFLAGGGGVCMCGGFRGWENNQSKEEGV